MKHTLILPGTGLSVSPFGLGCTRAGSAWTGERADRLLDYFVDMGGNVIDTARIYGLPDIGASEATLGGWLHRRGRRSDIVLMTKGGHPEVSSMHVSRMSRRDMELDLAASLRALRTDYVDIYFYHRDDEDQSVGELLECMEDFRRAGHIRFYACSNWSTRRMREADAYARAHGHRGICSESEWGQIARDVKLAEETGCAYHVCHVSTKESVEVIRAAKRRGVNVTCETAPHYLAFTQDDLQEDGRFKMNPPLRDQADQDALIEGLLDGTIDMLVTDHAPHSHEEKAKGLEKSAMGVVGLETSFAASYTHLVKKCILPLEKLVELMHTSPMRRFGCGTEIAVGQVADLTVFDLNETYTVDPETFLTMGRATPFTGTQLTGAGKLTMIGGEIVWKEDTL